MAEAISNNYYHRQYSNDFPDKERNYYFKQAARCTQIALPFISLYSPAGKAISLFSGSTRLGTHLYEVKKAKDKKACAYELFQVAVSVSALLNSVTNFTIGLYITTGLDLATNACHIGQDLWEQDYEKARDEMFQMVGSAIYAAMLVTNSTNVILAFFVYHALLNLWEARKEYEKGHCPEAIAKLAMAMIRASQANTLYRETYVTHPLENLIEKVDQQRCILIDHEGKEHDFGSNFHGFGKGIVKGMNLRFKKREDYLELDFKVNHVFRKKLDKKMNSLALLSKNKQRKYLARHKFSNESFAIYGAKKPVFMLDLDGVGSIQVGLPKGHRKYITDNIVKVRLEKGKKFQDLKQLLSLLDIQDVLAKSSYEDIKRMKIGKIFRHYCPKKATLLERKKRFFSLPLPKLQEEIKKIAPNMEGKLTDKELAKLTPREILPGRIQYGFNDLGDFCQTQGILNLSSIQTKANNPEEAFSGVASVLKMGLFSSEMRSYGEIAKKGLEANHDSVFFQANRRGGKNLTLDGGYSSFGNINILVSHKALDMAAYQFYEDEFGTRYVAPRSNSGIYLDRPSIYSWVYSLVSRPLGYEEHEVMIKDRVGPEFIIGIETKTKKIKDGLVDYLRNCEMIQRDELGRETIHGKFVDEFIKIAKNNFKQSFN
ncbi:MAG: hypothetical protein SNF33_00255 (plasmid) [Candidatus Algichlamydia australiensis]|nr:hypothetical protein [Chlamydiales bacterium]